MFYELHLPYQNVGGISKNICVIGAYVDYPKCLLYYVFIS